MPFFFLIIGYFSTDKSEIVCFSEKTTLRIFNIFVVASAIYFPMHFFQHGRHLELELLIKGTWFHLWFLGASFFSLFLFRAIRAVNFSFVLPYLSILILALFFVAEVYFEQTGVSSADAPRVLFRHLSAISFIWIGAWLKLNFEIVKRFAYVILIIGVLLFIAEIYFFGRFNLEYARYQMMPSIVPVCVGLILVSELVSYRLPAKLGFVSFNLALPIYIFHPLFIEGIRVIERQWNWDQSRVLLALEAFGLSFIFSVFIWQLIPKFHNILNGTLSFGRKDQPN